MQHISKDKIPKGWSHPLKTSDLNELFSVFPNIDINSIYYSHLPKTKSVLYIIYRGCMDSDSPETYSILVFSVPSKKRHLVKTQLVEKAFPKIQKWMEMIENASMTIRDQRHAFTVLWDGDSIAFEKEQSYPS